VTPSEVDALVRRVIIQLRAPFAVLSIVASPIGWNIQVRTGTRGTVSFTIADGRPLAMRGAIMARLEAEV
jgi:hypothetical protein